MLGEKMKLIRNYNGYSQRQIAEILKIERSTYASYETGRNRPDIFAVQRFAKIFNVSVDYILSLDDINIYRLRDQATDYAKRHKKESVISQLSSDEKILKAVFTVPLSLCDGFCVFFTVFKEFVRKGVQ